MSLICEYKNLQATYAEMYGPLTVVMYEVGKFYEFYHDGTSGADVDQVCLVLNIQSTRRNKKILEVSPKNPKLGGIPSGSVKKHEKVLMEADYTVVYAGQKKTEDGSFERKVVRIASKTTNLDYQDSIRKDTNVLMSIFVELVSKSIFFGCAWIDTVTGLTHAAEIESWDELDRIVSHASPSEALVFFSASSSSSASQKQEETKKQETQKLEADVRARIPCKIHMSDKKPDTIAYQNEVLKEVFPDTGLLSPAEHVGLERCVFALSAFVALIEFAYEHDENLVFKASIPTLSEPSFYMNPGALAQLDVTPRLLDMLNRCCTSMGRRLFADRLLSPSADSSVLEARYDAIERSLSQGKYKEIRKSLASVCDIERLWRKVETSRLTPIDLALLDSSLASASLVIEFESINFPEIDLEEAARQIVPSPNLFVAGFNPEIDGLQKKISESLAEIAEIAEKLNEIIGKPFVKVVENGMDIEITQVRFAAVKSKLAGFTSEDASQGKCLLRHPELYAAVAKARTAEVDLLRCLNASFSSFLTRILRHKHEIEQIAQRIAEIDVTSTCAMLAAEKRYRRPTLVSNKETSFVKAHKLRHPIVEAISLDTPYVPCDLEISSKGLILLGINMGGKSTTMKAIGLSVLMAQSGMFVACDKLELAPFTSLFTRIGMRDDIVRGHSTFMVEMLELRTILNRCDSRSLVLADEICGSTETVSALSIVGAGIVELTSKRTPTHLHELLDLEILDVRVAHVSATTDENGVIVYDRIIKDGPGVAVYGIEVCRSLGMGDDFLKTADRIRRIIMQVPDSIVRKKKSRYNASVFVDRCVSCGGKASETHHVIPREEADSEGFVGSQKVNRKSNLVSLCESCHLKIHKGTLRFDGFKMTSSGVRGVFSEII